MDTVIRPRHLPYQRDNIEHRLEIAEEALNRIRDALKLIGPQGQLQWPSMRTLDEIEQLVNNWHDHT